MKTLFLSLLVWTGIYVDAQTFTQPVEGSIGEVAFVDLTGNVVIRGTDDNKIMISFVPVNSEEHARPGGGSGSNLSKTGLTVERGGGKITFNGKMSKLGTGKYIIDLPARLSVNVQAGPDLTKSLNITGVKGKLDIHTGHDVEIKGLSNGLVLKNSSGHVKITAEKILRGPVSVITESGNVDFAMFIRLGVQLKLGTGTGTITAALSNGGRGLILFNGTQYNSSLNGGGTVVQIQSLSGNIRVVQFK